MFEISEAGKYMLEIAPFERKTGDYTLELKIVEALATDPAKRADQLMRAYSYEDVPGGVVGVIRDGELIFSKAYGMSDLSYGILYKEHTPSNIGSVSKQFTAMAILLLEQQGKLSLEDDVRKHIPELPDLGQVVKIKNMLNHTNGFREVFNLMPMTGWKGEDVLLRQEVIEILKRQEELQAAPGEEYNYNNSAFIMLAEIVERISGQTFPEFMEENVFGPLGMTSTVVRADPATIVPGASQGYLRDSTGYKEAGDLYSAYGAGGIYTTPADFARWMGNFSDPVVGGEEVIARLVRVDTLNNGDTMSYALGIGVDETSGLISYSHGGADIAHRAFAIYFPEIHSGVVAMSNNANFPSYDIAIKLARAFFKDSFEPEEEKAEENAEGEDLNEEAEETAEVEVPLDMLEAYAGKYVLKGMGVVLEYSVEDGVLKMNMEGQPEATLTPLSRVEFAYEGVEATIEFIWSEQGEVTGAVHSQGGQKYDLEAVPPYEPSLEELEAYTGRYFSKELDVFYKLEMHDSTLVLLIRNTEEIELSVVKKDVYKGDVFFIGELAFERDPKGSVTGFAASNGRTKGIRFERY
ncbi:MAG: class A beta-lactamase-related serine hydrolase [Gemmatimonadales bacterium]|nr:MAG: class A beta-lactamase-related serine hydrolase [Gemmatimonadales bacterium]